MGWSRSSGWNVGTGLISIWWMEYIELSLGFIEGLHAVVVGAEIFKSVALEEEMGGAMDVTSGWILQGVFE